MKTVIASVAALFASFVTTSATADNTELATESIQFQGVSEQEGSSLAFPWRVAHFEVEVMKGTNACRAGDVALIPFSEFVEGTLRIGVKKEQLQVSNCIALFLPVYEKVQVSAPYPVGEVRALEFINADGTTESLGVPNEILWRVGVPGDGAK